MLRGERNKITAFVAFALLFNLARWAGPNIISNLRLVALRLISFLLQAASFAGLSTEDLFRAR
jgi:hypothetical protein